MGMANFNKNMFVGVGGVEAINLSHFIGAVYGMENMMGRAHNPLRDILNHASEMFLQPQLNVWYILTVVAPNPTPIPPPAGTTATTTTTAQQDLLQLRGLYIGNSIECYNLACQLSLAVNFTILDRPPQKMVVYLDEDEFHSTWLGNKAIYRTRMAIADQGELIVLAPGVKRFGEDDHIDRLIRRFGYVGTPKIMQFMQEHADLKDNLSAVAHLIHGSSEGRFHIIYCPGQDYLTKQDIEGVGFQYESLDSMLQKYNVHSLSTGWQKEATTGEEFFFIKNPALGLWAVKSRFEN
jgi:hypothetical protein